LLQPCEHDVELRAQIGEHAFGEVLCGQAPVDVAFTEPQPAGAAEQQADAERERV
jgi:hypothetical protein